MNLLDRTRRLFKGLGPAAAEKVQYYSVSCVEGHRLRGERTQGYQALRCPTCGEGIFVLPRSPLPEPAAPSAPRGSSAKHARSIEPDEYPVELSDPLPHQVTEGREFDGEIDWVDEASEPKADSVSPPPSAAPSPSAPASPAPARRPAAERSQSAAPRRPKTAAPARPSTSEPRTVMVAEREGFANWARRRRNPLIFLSVALVVAATAGFRIWRANFRDLPRIAQIGRDQGLPALDSGDFDTAQQLLSEAKRAVDSLGGAFEGADEIRHGADEAALFTSLVQEPLETILDEASADPKVWSSRFKTYYQGRSILIDAQVTSAPNASGSGSYDLDYRILPNGEAPHPRRSGRIDLDGFRLFELSKPKVGDLVRFGARLESMTLSNGVWQVTLIPDSGVFLTHPRALEALGWPAGGTAPQRDEP